MGGYGCRPFTDDARIKCDQKRPCSRCVQSATTCTWHERVQNPVEQRLATIEDAITNLTGRLDAQNARAQASPVYQASVNLSTPDTTTQGQDRGLWEAYLAPQTQTVASPPTSVGKSTTFSVRQSSGGDVVSSGVVHEEQARIWFRTFFEGCDRFVPLFDPTYDTYTSVKHRSGVLFDVIVTYGCRAAVGSVSKEYQILYNSVRRHTSDLILRRHGHSIETIQALLILATYSDSGAILCDIALQVALQLDLPKALDRVLSSLVLRRGSNSQAVMHDLVLYASVRIWYGSYVLDQILSLDGGKPASISLQATSRRVRALLTHPYRTSLDMRLFAQVELNELRAAGYKAIASIAPGDDQALASAVDGGLLDLDLWLSDWRALLEKHVSPGELDVFALNVRIQHAWATLALQLKALAASGIDNIALMTDSQRLIATAAKEAAQDHLNLLLTSVPPINGADELTQGISCQKPYVAGFRHASEFVWAKNTFCVLIVLRLSILLGDSNQDIVRKLDRAREFLAELNNIGMGANISYTRILSQTVDKCQRAVDASIRAETTPNSPTGGDFHSFAPPQFRLEWDFPGLNLCYIPIDWQDLFLDFTATA